MEDMPAVGIQRNGAQSRKECRVQARGLQNFLQSPGM
jgi:hypothetical protein